VELVSIGEFARLSRLSPKALRLYDELGLLPPGRVDPDSGYRWYSTAQLSQARLVAALRQIEMPLAEINAVLRLDSGAAAGRLATYWAAVESEHSARRALTASLVARLTGERSDMYQVATRTIGARSLLCLHRHATQDQLLGLGRGFITRFYEQQVARVEGIEGSTFVIYYGQVNADSDGPVEWCRPLPGADAERIAADFPDLALRTEAAHEEAFVHLPSAQDVGETEAMAVIQALESWAAQEHAKPAGALRQVFIASAADRVEGRGPSCDFAIPVTR
jgi:DNA-binding transcriptional MerR regulator